MKNVRPSAGGSADRFARSDQAIEGGEDRAALLFAVCELDGEGVVRRWSAGAQRLFGWSAAQAIGGPPPMVSPPQRRSFQEQLAETADAAALVDAATTWLRSDGSTVEVLVSAAALDDEAGTTCGFAVIAQELTARRVALEQLEVYARDLRDSLARERRRERELQDSYLATVRALASAVEVKDGYTGAHIRRVHALGLLLARSIALDDAEDPQMSYGFLLHDVGKLSVPDAVLTKRAPLTDAEWQLMRRHPEEGVRILQAVPFLDRALEVVLCHHERWDGTGYPHGLAGEQIPIWARIFAVADAIDAMTSDRPYHSGRTLQPAIDEVLAQAGRQFDPGCAQALAALDREEIARLLEAQASEPPASQRR